LLLGVWKHPPWRCEAAVGGNGRGRFAGNTKPDEKLKGQSVWNLYFDHKGMNQGMYKVLWPGFDRDFITATHIQ
jgi:hypothetical protein